MVGDAPLPRNRLRVGHVEHLAWRLRPPQCQEDRLDQVVHVDEVARIPAAVDKRDVVAANRVDHPHRERRERSVDVGWSEDHDVETAAPAVPQDAALLLQFGMAVRQVGSRGRGLRHAVGRRLTAVDGDAADMHEAGDAVHDGGA